MLSKKNTPLKWWHLPALLAMLFALTLSAGVALAGQLTNATSSLTGAPRQTAPVKAAYPDIRVFSHPVAPSIPDTKNPKAANRPEDDAYLFLATAGSLCADPVATTINIANGSIPTVFELCVAPGTHDNLTGQQSYLTFTNSILQNVNPLNTTACQRSSTVNPILNTTGGGSYAFDAVLQNSVCNGPGPCDFNGLPGAPGELSYASGALTNPPGPVDLSPFRVATLAFCATQAGTATLNWQFTPPAPPNRDTQIINQPGMLVQNPSLFTNYTFNVAMGGPLPTDTPTNTPSLTRTRTVTRTPTGGVVLTSTPTGTATTTSTTAPSNTTTATTVPSNTTTRTNTTVPSNTTTATVIAATGTSTTTRTSTTAPSSTTTATVAAATSTTTATTVAATGTSTTTATRTSTTVPSNTPTNTVPVPTNTASVTRTNTVPVPTNTASVTPTNTVPVPTNTASVTRTNTVPVPTNTASVTRTNTAVVPTNTASVTRTNTVIVPTNTSIATSTRTNTAAVTSTRTATVGMTNTATRTATAGGATQTSTATAVPGRGCQISLLSFRPCLNENGCVEYSIPVKNEDDTAKIIEGTVVLKGRGNDVIGTMMIPPTYIAPDGITYVNGTICPSTSAPGPYRIEVTIRVPGSSCQDKRKSQPVHDTCTTMSDVPSGEWYYWPVQHLSSIGVASGYGDNTFRPNTPITRGQVAKMIVLALGLPVNAANGQRFSDVPSSHPEAAYVEAAARAGLASGYADGAFRPDATVTRGQLAKIVTLAAGWAHPNAQTATFRDVPTGSAFSGYVEAAYAHGLISGYADGAFRPNGTATRAQASKIIYGFVISTQQ